MLSTGTRLASATARWYLLPSPQGTWRVARPEQLTSYADELCRRENRVVLAGADFAPGVWNGFVDGALESALGVVDELESAFASGQI